MLSYVIVQWLVKPRDKLTMYSVRLEKLIERWSNLNFLVRRVRDGLFDELTYRDTEIFFIGKHCYKSFSVRCNIIFFTEDGTYLQNNISWMLSPDDSWWF